MPVTSSLNRLTKTRATAWMETLLTGIGYCRHGPCILRLKRRPKFFDRDE